MPHSASSWLHIVKGAGRFRDRSCYVAGFPKRQRPMRGRDLWVVRTPIDVVRQSRSDLRHLFGRRVVLGAIQMGQRLPQWPTHSTRQNQLGRTPDRMCPHHRIDQRGSRREAAVAMRCLRRWGHIHDPRDLSDQRVNASRVMKVDHMETGSEKCPVTPDCAGVTASRDVMEQGLPSCSDPGRLDHQRGRKSATLKPVAQRMLKLRNDPRNRVTQDGDNLDRVLFSESRQPLRRDRTRQIVGGRIKAPWRVIELAIVARPITADRAREEVSTGSVPGACRKVSEKARLFVARDGNLRVADEGPRKARRSRFRSTDQEDVICVCHSVPLGMKADMLRRASYKAGASRLTRDYRDTR